MPQLQVSPPSLPGPWCCVLALCRHISPVDARMVFDVSLSCTRGQGDGVCSEVTLIFRKRKKKKKDA